MPNIIFNMYMKTNMHNVKTKQCLNSQAQYLQVSRTAQYGVSESFKVFGG